MNLLIDTSILGQLCHPAQEIARPVLDWIESILLSGASDRVYLPEVCDYELRRKLLHLIAKGQSTHKSIQRLDELGKLLEYLPLDTAMMRKAAEFWSDARLRGQPTAKENSLDGDVILAAQAASIAGTIVTTNRKHLSQFVPAWDRTEIIWAYAFVCIRGRVDDLAFDWKDHFIVQDSQGRNWHCRQEATWNSKQEVMNNKMLEELNAVGQEVAQMYEKLFSSGHGTVESTSLKSPMTISPVPISQSDLLERLVRNLGDDSEDDTQSDDRN